MLTEYNLTDLHEYLLKVVPTIPKINNETEVISNIEKLFDNACQLIGITFPAMLAGLDFQPNNYQVEKLEAFLGELRSIFWLHDHGFTNIKPLSKKKKTKNPDFIANINNMTATIEVFCLTHVHQQKKDPSLGVYVNYSNKLKKAFMSNILRTKNDQIESLESEVKVLVCVINSEPISRLNRKNDFLSMLKQIHKNLNLKKSFLLGVVTGIYDYSTGELDDCIYPTSV